MKKLKVITIVGTRPEIIRLSRLIPKLDEYTDHVLVHTGQNYDRQLNEVFFEDLELRKPDYYLNVDTTSFGTVMGDTIKKSEEVFLQEMPDAVLILGDTNSAVAAVVAERLGIPVYHMEAGNRSFDSNVPEELNRRMIDHVASFNLPYNDFSMRNLLDEGIPPRFIQKTGSPIMEIYVAQKDRIQRSKILENLKVEAESYFLVSLHRQENVDSERRLSLILDSFSEVVNHWGLPVLVSTHPRTMKKMAEFGSRAPEGMSFHEPFGYHDYCKLQIEAKCVISDSGTIAEESSIFGFPAVTIRDGVERPEALETSNLIIAGPETQTLLSQVQLAMSLHKRSRGYPEGYETANFSDRVLSFVLSTAPLHRKWKGLNER